MWLKDVRIEPIGEADWAMLSVSKNYNDEANGKCKFYDDLKQIQHIVIHFPFESLSLSFPSCY